MSAGPTSRRRLAPAALLAVALTAVGCTGGGDATTTTTSSTTPVTLLPAPTTTPPEKVAYTDVRVWFVGDSGLESVRRQVRADRVPAGVLAQLFAGPSTAEADRGLKLVRNGYSGVASVAQDDAGVVTVRLSGTCSPGDPPTVVDLIVSTVTGAVAPTAVRVVDADGSLDTPGGPGAAAPPCFSTRPVG